MNNAFRKALVPLAVVSVLGAAPAHAQVKVGFLATLSGPSSDVGTDQYDGFMLALETLGGKLGGVATTVIKEDDQQKPDVALNGVTKLLEKEKVDIVTGLTFANILMAIQPKIGATDVPFVGSVAGPSPTAGALCKPNLFVTSWQSDSPAEAMGKYIEQRGVKRLATLTPNFQGGKDKITGLKRLYKSPLTEELYTPLNQLDFSAEITQLNSSQPDGIFAFYPGSLGVTFVRQYQQAGLANRMPLFTTNTIEGANVEAMGAAINGAYVADTWTPGMPNAESKAFVVAFEKKFNRSPSAYAAFSYDAAMLLDAAIKENKGNVTDKKALSRAIAAASFKSLRGPFRFGKNGYPVQNYHVFQVTKAAKGATFKLVAEKVLEAHADAYAAQCPVK
jgi:branched-chain amino acid transport system substrate-binding protein